MRMVDTMETKSSFNKTSDDASRATSVPRRPMATPIWAALMAGASLTPSPVMATISPLDFRASTMRSFCAGRMRLKTDTCFTLNARSWSFARHIDSNRHDVAFLKSARSRVEAEKLPILIDMSANSFHGMMGLFYMPEDAVLLHNLSFLGASEITAPEVFVVAMESLKDEIGKWGTAEALETSLRIPRARTSRDRLTLFRLRFDEGISRVPAHNIRVSPMQAMNRRVGPELVPQVAAGLLPERH